MQIITKSIDKTLKETERRRAIQKEYNSKNGMVPTTIIKEIRDIIEATKIAEEVAEYNVEGNKKLTKKEKDKLIKHYTEEMLLAAKNLQFERAAELRDIINEIKN
jgi:excinuclease ABC subunit B